jgi:hypothetical protein
MENNIQKIKDELHALSEKVSTVDRMEAALEFGVHVETINRYIRGEVRKEAFGLELLGFLQKRVAKREKAIA